MATTDEEAPLDPGALIRSRQYRVILVFAAIIGVLVSLVAWAFLELVHGIQVGVYKELPGTLGFDSEPWWWPLPWLAIAGMLTAIAITRLPGTGGHVPANGLSRGGGPTQPIELPGVLVAALATLGLGLVLGPEAPLIALGMGLGVLAVRRAKRDAPEQLVMVGNNLFRDMQGSCNAGYLHAFHVQRAGALFNFNPHLVRRVGNVMPACTSISSLNELFWYLGR